MYAFYCLHFLRSGRLHLKIPPWYLAAREVGGKAGSNIAITHYRTMNESYTLQASAPNMLKTYISVGGAFDIGNRNLVDCEGLC